MSLMDSDLSKSITPEKLIKECMQKVCAIIWKGRCGTHLPPEHDRDSTLNKWFNLHTPEFPPLRSQVDAEISENVHSSSIQLDIYVTGKQENSQSVLVERWLLHNEQADLFQQQSFSSSTKKTDPAQMFRRMVMLIRSLFAYVRILPCWPLARLIQQAAEKREDVDFTISYTLSSSASNSTPSSAIFDSPPSNFIFSTIPTPKGKLHISVFYRKDCNFGFVRAPQQNIMQTTATIITDYIPEAERSGLRQPAEDERQRKASAERRYSVPSTRPPDPTLLGTSPFSQPKELLQSSQSPHPQSRTDRSFSLPPTSYMDTRSTPPSRSFHVDREAGYVEREVDTSDRHQYNQQHHVSFTKPVQIPSSDHSRSSHHAGHSYSNSYNSQSHSPHSDFSDAFTPNEPPGYLHDQQRSNRDHHQQQYHPHSLPDTAVGLRYDTQYHQQQPYQQSNESEDTFDADNLYGVGQSASHYLQRDRIHSSPVTIPADRRHSVGGVPSQSSYNNRQPVQPSSRTTSSNIAYPHSLPSTAPIAIPQRHTTFVSDLRMDAHQQNQLTNKSRTNSFDGMDSPSGRDTPTNEYSRSVPKHYGRLSHTNHNPSPYVNPHTPPTSTNPLSGSSSSIPIPGHGGSYHAYQVSRPSHSYSPHASRIQFPQQQQQQNIARANQSQGSSGGSSGASSLYGKTPPFAHSYGSISNTASQLARFPLPSFTPSPPSGGLVPNPSLTSPGQTLSSSPPVSSSTSSPVSHPFRRSLVTISPLLTAVPAPHQLPGMGLDDGFGFDIGVQQKGNHELQGMNRAVVPVEEENEHDADFAAPSTSDSSEAALGAFMKSMQNAPQLQLFLQQPSHASSGTSSSLSASSASTSTPQIRQVSITSLLSQLDTLSVGRNITSTPKAGNKTLNTANQHTTNDNNSNNNNYHLPATRI